MRLVVDASVVAAALLGEPEVGASATDVLGGEWEFHAPAHWRAEVGNTIWKAARLGRLDTGAVGEVVDMADRLPIVSADLSGLWGGAIGKAIGAGHSVYDTLYLELAERLGTTVVSLDGPLRRKFPGLVRTPGDVLERRAAHPDEA